jgi:hypothetical protein
LTWRFRGSDCFSFSALSLTLMTNVYKNLEQRTLHLVLTTFFLMLTLLASFLQSFRMKSLIFFILRAFCWLLWKHIICLSSFPWLNGLNEIKFYHLLHFKLWMWNYVWFGYKCVAKDLLQ